MGVKTVKLITCDHCLEPVVGDGGPGTLPTKWVDASVYGIALHVDCWVSIGGPRVARVLGLDEISFRDASDTRLDRAWGPR